VRLGGLGQLKKSSDLIGNGTRDLPDCSVLPQPTTLPRAPRTDIGRNRICRTLAKTTYAVFSKIRRRLCIGNEDIDKEKVNRDQKEEKENKEENKESKTLETHGCG
jgi:hypothetical protein